MVLGFTVLHSTTERHLLEQVRLFPNNPIPEWLTLKPTGEGSAVDRSSCTGVLGIDLEWFSNRLREELRLAAPFHGNEPPYGFLNGLTDGYQAVIPQDPCFVLPKTLRNPRTFAGLGNQHACVIEEHVILIESAGVLVYRIEQPTDR